MIPLAEDDELIFENFMENKFGLFNPVERKWLASYENYMKNKDKIQSPKWKEP